MIPLNDLGRGLTEDGLVMSAVRDVVRSGWYVHGPQHQHFEKIFARYCQVEHCLGVASGTDALEIALRALTVDRQGSVLTAANAGGYTSVAARRAGLPVTYADVDPQTLCLDVSEVEQRLSGVAVVVLTHLYGRLGPADELANLCRSRGVALLEDCAQSVGARRDGRVAGSFGDLSTFSFYPTKNLGALGDGGAVCTSDPLLAERVRRLRQYGWSAKYRIDEDGGRNSRLDEMQAAVLAVRLQQLDDANARRRQVVARYRQVSRGPVSVFPANGQDHVAHLAVAWAQERDAVRQRLSSLGVQTDVHYPVPDHRQAAYVEQYSDVKLPVTEAASDHLLTLPCFPALSDDEVAAVCDALGSM